METPEKTDMELATILLIAKYGISLTEIILKNMKGVVTIDDATTRLSSIKTEQQYVDESAARLGIPARPLPI